MEQKGPEFQLKIEGVGLLRISLVDGEVIGLEDILPKVSGNQAMKIAQAANVAGESLEKEDNFLAAARAYLAAYQLAVKSGQRLNMIAIMINLGLALKRAGQLDHAREIYQDALDALQQPEQDPAAESRRSGLLANVLLNSATLHLLRNAPLEAERAANWCLDLVRYSDDEASRSVARQCEAILAEAGRNRKTGPPPATVIVDRPKHDK